MDGSSYSCTGAVVKFPPQRLDVPFPVCYIDEAHGTPSGQSGSMMLVYEPTGNVALERLKVEGNSNLKNPSAGSGKVVVKRMDNVTMSPTT